MACNRFLLFSFGYFSYDEQEEYPDYAYPCCGVHVYLFFFLWFGMMMFVSMAMNTDVNMLIPSTMNAGFILVFAREMNGYSLPPNNGMINRFCEFTWENVSD